MAKRKPPLRDSYATAPDGRSQDAPVGSLWESQAESYIRIEEDFRSEDVNLENLCEGEWVAPRLDHEAVLDIVADLGRSTDVNEKLSSSWVMLVTLFGLKQ